MRPYRLTKAPREISRQRMKLDNITLIPASLLPFKEDWQRLANDLPNGDILIVLPPQAKQQRVARSVAARLRASGRPVSIWHHDVVVQGTAT